MAQPQNITSTEAAAYTAGWVSTAKDVERALAGAAKKFGDESPLLNFFQDGYEDKQSGSAKWSALEAKELEATDEEAAGVTHVETDGVVVAVTRHLELVPEAPSLEEIQEDVPAHEIIDGAEVEAGTPGDEVADALAEIQEEAPAWKLNSFGETIKRISEENAAAAEEASEEATSDEWVSIASLRRLAAETPRGAARQAVRALVVTKKGAYRRGFTAATEGKILSEVKETYLAKRDPKFLQDFVQGYEDAANKRGMGASWE